VGGVRGLVAAPPEAAVTVVGAPPARTRRTLPVRLLLLAVVTLAAVAVLAVAGLSGSLVYYRTPSELVSDPGLVGHRVRVGGLVVVGSVQRTAGGVRFELTDGVQEVPVVNAGQPRGVFREGQGAVVEGVLGRDGVFRSDVLLVKHSNEYEPPAGGTGRPKVNSG
jgi:cytochrome c-type biogenesis protein CcmE